MRKIILTALCALCFAAINAATPTMTPKDGYPRFALGADLSWTPYIEANKLHTYYKGYTVAADQVTNIPDMVIDHGIDAVRLRVWVNPKSEVAMAGFSFNADGYKADEMSTFGTCSVDEMVALAQRFAMQGQRLMVVFQLSDSWADPGRQFIPGDWADCKTIDQLIEKASAHVTEVLTLLRDNNVNVAWVQIGNETNGGMLKYPMPTSTTGTQTVKSVPYGCEISGNTNSPSTTSYNFVKMFSALSDVAKGIYPNTKVVLHLTKTAQWSNISWVLGVLKKAGLTASMCDYIGLSLYPGIDDGQEDYTAKWKTYADAGIKTINNIYSTYGYRTLLCEIGMNNEYSASANTAGVPSSQLQKCYIEQCNADVRAFTQYLIDNLDAESSTCDGLWYWEPETDYMKEYKKGACVSITPGASWPRTKVTANDWWTVIKEHSTFPAGGLVEYQVGDDTPQFNPDPELQLYLYYYDNAEHFVPLTTTDGLVYKLTGFAAKQWFNFKVVTDDWSIALGNAEIGIGQVGYLNNNNDWYAWTSTTVSSGDTWWLRHDKNAMTITSDDVCPWPELASIGTIVYDADITPEYYSLQGVRIHNPSTGIYILKRGALTQKIYITNESYK